MVERANGNVDEPRTIGVWRGQVRWPINDLCFQRNVAGRQHARVYASDLHESFRDAIYLDGREVG